MPPLKVAREKEYDDMKTTQSALCNRDIRVHIAVSGDDSDQQGDGASPAGRGCIARHRSGARAPERGGPGSSGGPHRALSRRAGCGHRRGSLYPLQIVQAQRYLDKVKTKPDLKPDPNWDGSVVSLMNYPEVVKMMSDDLDWTADAGRSHHQPAAGCAGGDPAAARQGGGRGHHQDRRQGEGGQGRRQYRHPAGQRRNDLRAAIRARDAL